MFRTVLTVSDGFTIGLNNEFNAIAKPEDKIAYISGKLSAASASVYAQLPTAIQLQLSMDRDPHGNVQVSLIETEKLLAQLVKQRLYAMKAEGKYVGKFSSQTHFFGYEGRCAAPSNFDADYCYSLGFNAAAIIGSGATAYMSYVGNLAKSADEWTAGAVPLTAMMNVEHRHGADKPVIKKALVELDDAPFKFFAANRDDWAVDRYGKRWSELLPGNEQLFLDDVLYVHWYDCLCVS